MQAEDQSESYLQNFCTQGEILAVSLCLLLSLLVVASILGNSLVCLAVTTDPNLR